MAAIAAPLPPTPWALQLRRLVGRRGRWLRGGVRIGGKV